MQEKLFERDNLKDLVKIVEDLKNSSIKEIIDGRMKEFESFRKKSSKEIFKELCFCLLTANFSAHGGLKIQNAINEGFFTLSEEELGKKLAELGHRFPNMRAKFISEARIHKDNIKETLESFKDEKEMRNWLADNIKGLGMKEASHFLRNIGYKNLAIVDFHIIDLLVKSNVLERPKTITRKKYFEVEDLLEILSKKTNVPQGELDLYLWYKETGKILK